MINPTNNSNPIWQSIQELGYILQQTYSVTGKDAINMQYLSQVKQYPLYLEWFNKIENHVKNTNKEVSIIEYGSGPGLLAERLVHLDNVIKYTVIEPEKIFREMTRDRIGDKGIIIDDIAESYLGSEKNDLVIATATYHHFYNKPKALENIFSNLKNLGELIIADVFLPKYGFNKNYDPKNKLEFTTAVLDYAATQITSMPNPQLDDVVDQIKTAFLDILRIEELKVSLPICLTQLEQSGFSNISYELMKGLDKSINYDLLAYHYITAKKGDAK